MSYRPLIQPYVVIPNAFGSPANGNSMAANITSAPTIVQNLSAVCYSYSWSGATPVGTISIQGSNDYKLASDGQTVINAGTWTTLTFLLNGTAVQSAPISGNTGNGIIDITTTAIWALRTVYTATSGTGTLTVVLNAKVQ